jgi:hypothetical protein
MRRTSAAGNKAIAYWVIGSLGRADPLSTVAVGVNERFGGGVGVNERFGGGVVGVYVGDGGDGVGVAWIAVCLGGRSSVRMA